MGLKLRYHLFHGADAGALYDAYADFYAAAGHPVHIVSEPCPEEEWYTSRIHQQDACWTILNSHGGWEWEVRRQAQLYASRTLRVSGLLVWVFDGDYWLYELFSNGTVLDQFIQDPSEAQSWFPGKDCEGKAGLLAQHFPWVAAADAAAYLVQQPRLRDDDPDQDRQWAEYDRLNEPVRANDEFRRFDECAVLDFLRMLGVRVALRDHYVRLHSPEWRTFGSLTTSGCTPPDTPFRLTEERLPQPGVRFSRATLG